MLWCHCDHLSENLNCTNLFFQCRSSLVPGHGILSSLYKKNYSCSTIRHVHVLFFPPFVFSFFPIAKSCQTDPPKKFGLLSQLALSSHAKFFLKSPPKFRKNAEADEATGLSDADLEAELDSESEASESPNGQYENCLSAGLDCAISDLVSLDSQAEVDQGILLRGDGFKSAWVSLFGAGFPLGVSLFFFLI